VANPTQRAYRFVRVVAWGNDFIAGVRILWDSTLVDCAVMIRRWRTLLAPATFGAVQQSTSLLVRAPAPLRPHIPIRIAAI
jgi:hypothetical protein